MAIVDLKEHEIKTLIGAGLVAIASFYDKPGLPWAKSDLIGELQRLIVLADQLPPK